MTSRAPISMPGRSATVDEPRAAVRHEPPALLSVGAMNRRRAVAAMLAVGWCAALAWLALMTSNPITLNRRQILAADAVVTARIEDRDAGRIRIVRQWFGAALPAEISVRHLDSTAARGAGEWILPLRGTEKGYEVLPSELPSRARLVSPATPEAVRQLAELLESRPAD